MQKHCIEVVKNTIDTLNPGQVIVDTSDQPVYALSRRLQQMFLLVLENIYPSLVDSTLKNFF